MEPERVGMSGKVPECFFFFLFSYGQKAIANLKREAVPFIDNKKKFKNKIINKLFFFFFFLLIKGLKIIG